MSLWRQLTRGLRVLTNRTAADRDLGDEVDHYLEEATAAFVTSGLSADDARRAARLEVGNMTVVREQVRAYGWENVIETLLSDLRYGARRLRSHPGFAAVGALTLALGIGASTAIFSAVNPILFEPLPYPHAGRVTMIWDFAVDGSRLDVTFGTYRELVERSRSFDAIAVMKPWQPTMTGATEPERFDGQRVSAGYFRALGVLPALGRDFQTADDRFHGPNVVILSDGLWRRRFGGDGTIVGRQVTLNDSSHTVVGVMPGAFENVLAPSAEIWAPLQYDISLPPQGREWGHHLRMVGRLRPGVGTDHAARELDTIAHTPVAEFSRVPWASLKQGLTVNALQDDVTRGVKPALVAVLGAVLLVLVIACVNVTNLLLARGAERRGEFAMRAALGAGRGRLIRQLLTESLLLALIGGALGMVVAQLGVRAFVALSPRGLPRAGAIRIDETVFAFGLGITTAIGLVVGLIPALHASRDDLHVGLQQSSRRTAGSHRLTRSTLVVVEVALALVLLVSAGLLLRSLERLFAVAPGFDASHLLTMQVQTSGHRFDDDLAIRRFFAQALDAVRQVPGVASAAFTSQLPLSGDFEKYGVHFESSRNDDPNEDGSALRYAVSPGYFETMGIPLGRGRLLDAHDVAGKPVAVLINESFARRKFPGQDPIGQRVHIGSTDQPWDTIVGVVGDVKHTSLAVSQADAAYTTTAQWYFPDNPLWLVVRARGDAAALAPAVRNAIWSVDKDQPIVRVATMDDLVAASAAERRFALILFEAFALVALVLAATGIYGVMSGSVTERTREIGVRSALGASRRDILVLVVRQGMTLTGLGVAIGVAGAAAATQAIVAMLFRVSPLDPVTYLGVIALVAGAAMLACGVPAWRAARVDPASTLRAE
jgi:putative ABC transport system permease protein